MKTKRGSYFVLRVKDLFYSGTKPVVETKAISLVSVSTPDIPGKRRVPKYMAKNVNNTWSWGRPLLSHRFARPKYDRKQETKETFTGQFTNMWDDDANKAKRFRIHDKALTKAQELAKELGIDIKMIQIELKEGEKK